MSMYEWLPAPVGIDAPRWVTRPDCRTVLIVAHTMVSCLRLLDVVEYVESDSRIQVVFTAAPATFGREVPQFLAKLNAMVIPWHQATRERFDLAVAAAFGGLHELHGPVMVMPHGAGYGKVVRTTGPGCRRLADRPVAGLDAQRLTWDGRVLASALLLSHHREREVLRRQCPDALAVTTVAGDPCLDRLISSVPLRTQYRRAYGIADRQRFVVVSSTWGSDGLYGRTPELLPQLLDQLVAEPASGFRVGALLHPAVWSAHGGRQIRAWLRDCLEAGLVLLDPTEDWRPLVVAADYVIGDHGSVTAYAAAIGRQVVRLAGQSDRVAPGTAQDLVITQASQLDPLQPVPQQLATARVLDRHAVTAALSSRPGRADLLIRRTMYRLLGLPAPGEHRRSRPIPVPETRSSQWMS